MTLPRWEGTFENYSKGFVHKNEWRTRSIVPSREDALQECAEVFSRLQNIYSTSVTEPKHFMALYKTALVRHWQCLVRKQFHSPDYTELTEQVEQSLTQTQVCLPDSALAEVWQQASKELKAALTLIVNAPSDLLGILLQENSAGMDRLWKRAAKVECEHNLVEELRELLSCSN
jgi:hypothetical protein